MSQHSNEIESDLPKIGAPASRALANIDIYQLKQLPKYSEAELKKLHGMGPKALGILRQALSEKGWSFADRK